MRWEFSPAYKGWVTSYSPIWGVIVLEYGVKCSHGLSGFTFLWLAVL